jgi:hypothetical protein
MNTINQCDSGTAAPVWGEGLRLYRRRGDLRETREDSTGARIWRHIRSNMVGYVALLLALGGTAYAVDGPLAGQNQVGSEDIINGAVKKR